MPDIPKFTDHETRALIYIYETEQQITQKPSISELCDSTGWSSKYYTRAWKRLQPRNLVERTVDGKNTRLTLTDKGKQVASLLMDINKVLEQ